MGPGLVPPGRRLRVPASPTNAQAAGPRGAVPAGLWVLLVWLWGPGHVARCPGSPAELAEGRVLRASPGVRVCPRVHTAAAHQARAPPRTSAAAHARTPPLLPCPRGARRGRQIKARAGAPSPWGGVGGVGAQRRTGHRAGVRAVFSRQDPAPPRLVLDHLSLRCH